MKKILILTAILLSSSVFAYSNTDKVKDVVNEKVSEAKKELNQKMIDAEEELSEKKDKYEGKLEAKSEEVKAEESEGL